MRARAKPGAPASIDRAAAESAWPRPTHERRSLVPDPAVPDIPTVGEFVPGFESSIWFGLSAPRNTPPEIIDKLDREINAGLADSKLKARYPELGSTVFPTSPADFGKFIVAETEKWAKVVKFSGAKPD